MQNLKYVSIRFCRHGANGLISWGQCPTGLRDPSAKYKFCQEGLQEHFNIAQADFVPECTVHIIYKTFLVGVWASLPLPSWYEDLPSHREDINTAPPPSHMEWGRQQGWPTTSPLPHLSISSCTNVVLSVWMSYIFILKMKSKYRTINFRTGLVL